MVVAPIQANLAAVGDFNFVTRADRCSGWAALEFTMSNPVLFSESFERAAYSLQHAMDRFGNSSQFTSDVDRFVGAVDTFRASVDKMTTVMEETEDSVELTHKLRRLVLILAENAIWQCDNVGGEPRRDCQCDSCEGRRLLNELA